MSSQDFSAEGLRRIFLDYFKDKGHSIIASASLVPENDPTSLFVSAGMQPLVPYLMGEKHPEGNRLANIQRCVRTGDIDEVGDESHLTYFEMMGYWSLGDYWKKEAIEFIFEFLTKELKIDPARFAITCFEGDPQQNIPKDTESAKVWMSLGVPEERIAFLGYGDNFWGPVGECGPCGPDTELFIWVGESEAPDKFDPEDKNWMELCNDVFMEYNKTAEGYQPLEQKNVDFGMGFERLLAYLQGESDVYKTDVFWPIVKKIEEISGKEYEDNKRVFRLIADHLRAVAHIVSDGVKPSNKGSGYIVRRLIRRSIAFGYFSLEIKKSFSDGFAKVVQLSNLRNEKEIIEIYNEEEYKYAKVIEGGIGIIKNQEKIDGKFLFDLEQSHGLYIDIALEAVSHYSIKLSPGAEEEAIKLREKHKELSRTSSAGMFKGGLADNTEITTRMHTATHLLLSSLKKVLGDHVEQRGSNITPERIRFDFSHSEKMTDEQIKEVEEIVNQKIKESISVEVDEMTLEQARQKGATGIFDNRYGNKVKVYTIEDPSGQVFSKEICGGPHVKNTSEIGQFKIIKEQSSSAGIRRIKAILN